MKIDGSGPRIPENLILVNGRNQAIGRAEKYFVHQAGLLHRAFSIFLVDEEGRVLLQQRSFAKYHSGGLWANTCCGHPRPGEQTASAAFRRLGEELGVAAPLRCEFRTRYRTALQNGLFENEIVYVYFGATPESVAPNPDEVSAVAWMDLEELQAEVGRHPQQYAYWLRFYVQNHFPALCRGARMARDAARLQHA